MKTETAPGIVRPKVWLPLFMLFLMRQTTRSRETILTVVGSYTAHLLN